MNDVVVVELITNGFWLILLGGVALLFRKDLSILLGSLARFNVAGAAFEFKDKKDTIHSYALLSDTLIEILGRSDRIEDLLSLLEPSQIQKLGSFAIRYTSEVAESEWNDQLLRNISYLLIRFGYYQQAIELIDALSSKRPANADLLNLRALALMTTRLKDNVDEAEQLFSELTNRFPERPHFNFNHALSASLLEKYEEALNRMERAISLGYAKSSPNCLNDPLFYNVRENRSDEVRKLQEFLDRG